MKLRLMDKTFVCLTGLAVLIILALLFTILGNIVANGWTRISWEFLSANPREGMTEGGIFPAIFGTALLVLLMSIFVVPLGVLVAIYFSEYANRTSMLYRWSRSAVDNLAGVPSIVFGLFGLGFFVQWVGRGMDTVLFGGHLTFGQPAILEHQREERIDAGIGGGEQVLALEVGDGFDAGIGSHDDRLGAHGVDDADRNEGRALGGEIGHRSTRPIGELAVAIGDQTMRRSRAIAGADIEIDALLLIVTLVLAEREAGMGAVIHPVEPQADIIIGTRWAGERQG